MFNKKVDLRRKGILQESETATSRRKGSVQKNELENKDDEVFTTFHFKRDYSEISDDTDSMFIFPRNWPEWSDAEINLEVWKLEDTEKRNKLSDFSPHTQVGYYHDPEGILLPHSLIRNVDSWKRPHEAFNNPVILYDDTLDFIDIISSNRHLLNSRRMRWIISSIATVQAIADGGDFTQEGEHSQYTPNGGTPWRPWHHIYSMCKAGKASHKPLLNPAGKYIIRLYYLGCWRKFVVDDKLPFDAKGQMLLPTSSIKGELWPMLLTKGLLKIASHTWNKKEDLLGFQPISCLTGWICEEISDIKFDDVNLWKLIKKFTEEKKKTQEEILAIEIRTDKQIEKVKKSSHHVVKEKTPPQKLKKAKPNNILGILRFWNEKYNSNEVVHQLFLSNEERLPSPRGILTYEPMRRMNFPVLFQQYKEKGISRSEIKKDSSNYTNKKERNKKLEEEKQEDIPECFIKAYSHIFDLKEVPPKDLSTEKKEDVPQATLNSVKEAKSLISKSSKLMKSSKTSAKGKSSISLRRPPNTQKIMAETGKWLTFSSLKSLLEGIVLIHKPSLYTTHVQKPDYVRLLSPRAPSKKLDGICDIDDESEVESELGNEEEFFVFFDSSEEIQFVLSMNILPTPTKLDDNYGTLFDLMVNACEGKDEEYFNYKSSKELHENINSLSIDGTLTAKTESSNEKTFSWMDSYDEYDYELLDGSKEYILKEHIFNEKYAEVQEVHDGEASDQEDEEWEVDEYELKMYNLADSVKKKCEESPCKLKLEIEEEINSTKGGLMPNKSSLNEEKVPFKEETKRDKDRLEKYLLLHKLSSVSSKIFHGAKEIEAFCGSSLLCHNLHPMTSAAHLEIEKFEWDCGNIGHPSLQFTVEDTKNVHFELPPGRNILRVTIRSASFYALHFLSNIEAVISSMDDLFTEMTKDCIRLTHYEKKIHQNIENLVKELADDENLKAIKDFNNCYLPDNYRWLPGDTKELVHQAFQESIHKILTENLNYEVLKEVVNALRAVFLNPSFGKNKCQHGKILDKVNNSCYIQQSKPECYLDNEKVARCQQAAVKIQSFFQRIICQKCLSSLQENRSLLSTQVNLLLNLLNNKPEISVMRTMLNERPILKITYDLQNDLHNEIDMYEWAGLALDVDKLTWIPLARYSFKWDSKEPIKSSILLTCPITLCVTTVIDNETGKILPRISNNYSPYSFKENMKGYTFFAYAIDEDQSWSCVPWKINHVVMKGSPPMQMLINGQPNETGKPPKLRYDTLNGYYIPNEQKIICSFTMSIAKLQHICVCFTTSNKLAQFRLEIFNINKDLIVAQEAEGMLVIPFMFLDGQDTEEAEHLLAYTGEVTLLGEWPLSEFQKIFAEMQWVKDTALLEDSAAYYVPLREPPKFTLPGSPIDSQTKQEENLMDNKQDKEKEPATWSLHILVDSPHEVTLEEIKQKGEEMKNMKREWEAVHPGILKQNARLFQKHEQKKFTDCFVFSKKEPTRFKNKLPAMEELEESNDEDYKDPKSSKQTDRKSKIDPKKLAKFSKRETTESDDSSHKSNDCLLESETISDIAPPNGLKYTSGKTYDDHWVDHHCEIEDDIDGFNKMSNYKEATTKYKLTQFDLRSKNKNEHDSNEFIEFIRRNSSGKFNQNINLVSNENVSHTEFYTKQKSDFGFRNEKHEKTDECKEKWLNKNDENITSSKDENKENIDFESKIHDHTEKKDEKCCIDHYRNYYENRSDDLSSSSQDELNINTTEHLMTIDDWVNIQAKMIKKQERFKKKLIKVFTEVESLVRAPFTGHFAKWNLYLVNTLKNSEHPFHQIEKLRNAYRRAKKKQNMLQKEKIKLEIKRVKELKASTSKKGKKAKGKKDDVKLKKEREDKTSKVKLEDKGKKQLTGKRKTSTESVEEMKEVKGVPKGKAQKGKGNK